MRQLGDKLVLKGKEMSADCLHQKARRSKALGRRGAETGPRCPIQSTSASTGSKAQVEGGVGVWCCCMKGEEGRRGFPRLDVIGPRGWWRRRGWTTAGRE